MISTHLINTLLKCEPTHRIYSEENSNVPDVLIMRGIPLSRGTT